MHERTSTGYETAVSIIKALGWFLDRAIKPQYLRVNAKDYYLISVFHQPRTKRSIIAHYITTALRILTGVLPLND